MLIIFGIKTKVIADEICLGDICPGCNSQNLFLTFVQSYFHLFWIPFIPLTKRPLVYCRSCGMTINKKEVPEKFLHVVEEQKLKVKTPKYYFAGLAILSLLLMVMIFGQ